MRRPDLRSAILIWVAILAVISVRVALSGRANSVYPVFSGGGRQWLAGADLYGQRQPELDLFRYPPAVAVAFVPWGLLPDRAGGQGRHVPAEAELTSDAARCG